MKRSRVLGWTMAIVGIFLVWYFAIDLIKVKEVQPPAGDTGHFVDVAGLRTYYRVEGQGPAVLLLHGTSASGYSWHENVDALAKHFTVYYPDVPGYGYSAKVGEIHWARDQARWAGAFLDAVGVKKAGVVGHSMGGEIALWLAIDRPELVDRLILVDAAGVGGLTGSFRMVATPILGEMMLKATGESTLRYLMRQAYVNKEAVTDDMVRLYHRFMWAPGARGAFLTRLRRYEADTVTLQQRLGEVKAPVLAVWGDQDPYFDLTVARKLADQLPGTELLVIPDTGHVPHEEHPERFNQAATEWLLAGAK